MRILCLILVCLPLIGLTRDLEKTYMNDSLESIFSLSTQQHYGFIIIHSRAIRAINNSYPLAARQLSDNSALFISNRNSALSAIPSLDYNYDSFSFEIESNEQTSTGKG